MSVLKDRAVHLITRLRNLDLAEERDFDQAVEQVTKVLTGATSGEAWKALADVIEANARGEPAGVKAALLRCSQMVRAEAQAYAYPTMENWWKTTSYPDVIEVQEQMFRDKPIHLKRIALEAFNAGRRSVAAATVEDELPE